MQVPETPTHIGEFDTLQVIDDIEVPNTNWNRGDKPEPITEYFGNNHPDPDMDYGDGGATQAITNTPIKDFKLKEIKQ